MALTPCPECTQQMSAEADACPHCGHPNKKIAARKNDNTQNVGCLLIIVGLILLAFLPWIVGGALAVVGFVMVATHTRFK